MDNIIDVIFYNTEKMGTWNTSLGNLDSRHLQGMVMVTLGGEKSKLRLFHDQVRARDFP